MNTIIKSRERRSVLLTKDEIKRLKAMSKQFNTLIELSENLNIPYQTLKRIMEMGRGNEVNINIIKSAIV